METPGLGNKITFPDWLDQFAGQGTAEPLAVVKGGTTAPGTIDAITGATQTSRAIESFLNRELDRLLKELRAHMKLWRPSGSE